MKLLFPRPILFGVLLGLWLLLHQSLGLGHILLGGVIALLAGMVADRVIPEPVRFRKPLKFLQLLAIVVKDVAFSNFAVLSVLLKPKPEPRSAFVEMDLELTDSFALALLAGILTATPGSAWLEHNRTKNRVIIHVFDDEDTDAWVKTIKTRYETLLLEIFQ